MAEVDPCIWPHLLGYNLIVIDVVIVVYPVLRNTIICCKEYAYELSENVHFNEARLYVVNPLP